jgi:hypothetical protein
LTIARCSDETRAFLKGLHARGIDALVEGENIAVAPASQLTEDERTLLHKHKAEVITLLTQAPVDQTTEDTGAVLLPG